VKTAADQIAVIGTVASGATASIHVREAVAGGTGFLRPSPLSRGPRAGDMKLGSFTVAPPD
jgi:hypothetical protein